jgi:hypothetical protein
MWGMPAQQARQRVGSALIADKHVCALTMDAIADLAGTSCTVVQRAVRTAKAVGLIKIVQGSRYNTITIVSAEWKAWLDRYGDAPPDGPRWQPRRSR